MRTAIAHPVTVDAIDGAVVNIEDENDKDGAVDAGKGEHGGSGEKED